MALTRYYCTHCSHAFEAEEKDNIECPSCVWTSSVLKEADYRQHAAEQQIKDEKNTAGLSRNVAVAFDAVRPLLILLLALALLGAAFIYLKPQIIRLTQKTPAEKPLHIAQPGQEAKPEKQGPASKKTKAKAGDTLTPEAKPTVLSDQEKAVLARKIVLDPARELSAMEQDILGRTALLKTGRIEKLPGPVWNLELFKKMLEEQQAAYQVPLPRSYRGKLQDLFETKYLAGAQAFTDGRLLEARNLWVEALAFPIYSNDIEKHRGVVLTMLRSFINDTLSKIGALNGMLVEGPVRDREAKLNEAYARLQKLIVERQWQAAFDVSREVLLLAEDFNKTALQRPQVPAYPAGAQIDRDIGKSLYDLLETSRPAVADVGALERDVRIKKQVIETLLPDQFTEAAGYYRDGLAAMDEARWQEAIKRLARVKEPAVLEKDSAEKIKILEKIVRSELDSSKVSG